MKNRVRRNIASLILTAFILLSIGLLYPKDDFQFKKVILIVLYYLFFSIGIGLLPPNRLTTPLVHIIRIPLYLILLFEPLLGVLYLFLFMVIVPFGTFSIIFYLILFSTNPELDTNILWYLTFGTTTIFLMEFFEQALNIVLKIIPTNNLRKLFSEKFALSKLIIDNKKIRVIIYCLYLPFIIAYAVVVLGKFNIDTGMLQASFFAFATFLAYDRIKQLNLEEVKMNWRDILKTILKNSALFHKKD